MGQACSSDGENTGKRDNAQSNAARPAVTGNHDLTRADGISAAPACKPKPVIGCGSARRCPGLVNFRFAARTPDEPGLLDCPRCTPYKCRATKLRKRPLMRHFIAQVIVIVRRRTAADG